MKTEFAASQLRCPVCLRDRTLQLTAAESDEREVREGTLRCSACGAEQPVHRGVGELLVGAPDHVTREAAGLGRFAEAMRNDGWTPQRVRALPDVDDGYWYVQATSIRQLFDLVDLRPGQRLVDLGSNTCWASNFFAVRGLQVVALDISLWELQGLQTADYFIQDGVSYFERVLGSMNELPLASESLDYVYACEVLHHNDRDGLRRTFEEAYRVLKPGGKMLIINETLKKLTDRSGVHVDEVAHFEGYEHAHWAARYRWEAIRAGFTTELVQPIYHHFFGALAPEHPPLRQLRAFTYEQLRRHPLGRRIYHARLNNITGAASYNMIATKSTAGAARRSVAKRIPV